MPVVTAAELKDHIKETMYEVLDTWPRQAHFKTSQVPPINPPYIEQSTLLQMRVVAGVSQSINVAARVLLPSGRVMNHAYSISAVGQTTAQLFAFNLSEGWLLSVQVNIGGTNPRRGTVFVSGMLIDNSASAGPAPHTPLFSGYLVASETLGFPFGPMLTSIDGPGNMFSDASATPAAGADAVFTVPTAWRYRVRACSAQLVTAVAAANRQPDLIIDDGATIFYRIGAVANQAASLTVRYSFGAGCAPNTGIDTTTITLPIPDDMVLLQGWRIRTSTTGIQAADQWTALAIMAERWVEL